MTARPLTLGLIVVLAAGLCAGCRDTFLPKNFALIHVGQGQFDVERVLGKPTHRFADTWTYLRSDPYYKAVIRFKDGRVVDKQWYGQ